MSSIPYTFRRLAFAELEVLVQWAAQEGWNPGLDDAELFWHTDPEGFYGYFEGDCMIGGGSIVSYDGLFGFMGFFIVHPDYRAHGIGRSLWMERRTTLLNRLQVGAAIGMDGVMAMQGFYQKGGFQIAFRDERYVRLGASFEPNPHIRRITEADYETVAKMDTACFGVPRDAFLRPWLFAPHAQSFCYSDAMGLQGYAVVRKCQEGYKIGPLFAESTAVARALYEACLNAAPGESVYLDIPTTHEGALQLVADYGATYVFECARMYYGTPPETKAAAVFGISSFELG